MASVVIYTRISQDRSGEGLGVERQERECRQLVERMGFEVGALFSDNDISATNGSLRPGFEALLASRPSAIVTWHQDRLLRLTRDLERVISLNVPIYTVTAGDLDLATPAGRAVARTIAAWSTYEGEQKAARQRASNRQRASRGVWPFSRRPYGYRRDGRRVVIVPEEAAIVREGYSRYLSGESYYALSADWNARGVATHGGPWSMSRVRELLRNEHYAGIATYKGELVEAESLQWEPLIDRSVWDQYVSMRALRRRAGSWSNQTRHLLSGLAVCGNCGSRLLARPDHGKMRLACVEHWCVSRLMGPVESMVLDTLFAKLIEPGVVARLRETPDIDPLVKELARVGSLRDGVMDLMDEGLLDIAGARRRAALYTEQIVSLQQRLSRLRGMSPLTDLVMAESIPDRWEQLDLPQRRRVISDLGLRVTLYPTRPGRRPFDVSSVVCSWDSGTV